MKNTTLFLLIAIILISCKETKVNRSYDIIPYPNFVQEGSGFFAFEERIAVFIPMDMEVQVTELVQKFVDHFGVVSGINLFVTENEKNVKGLSTISFIKDDKIEPEGYHLFIKQRAIQVKASDPNGFFYGIQTLKQLMPVEIYGKSFAGEAVWQVPCLTIKDVPRFSYRGMHLDVARHFFPVTTVKKYMDILAFHKLNTFHWHLTDDQGWRIEIKKYPRLTEIGSIRKKTMIRKEWDTYDYTPYGGYYTQEEIREIVEYAAERFITVIPEIDLPGHMMAALAAYPELGCTGGPYDVSGQWGVREDVLCAGKEEIFTFLQDVLSEVMELFPSEYIHIGGDECPKVRWENCPYCQKKIKELGIKSDEVHTAEHYLQSYVISRMEEFLNGYGKKIIGWEEILEGGLAPNATVMSWRGMEGGIEAANQNHYVIMTPTSHLYFDYCQSLERENEPFGIGGYVPLEKVYSFDPVPDVLEEENRKYIWGVQANLWTEYIHTPEHLEYMLLPRLAALSEVQWKCPENKDWKGFAYRLDGIMRSYEFMGYNYATHIYDVTTSYDVNLEVGGIEVSLYTQGDAPIYYVLEGKGFDRNRHLYSNPIQITGSCTLKAFAEREHIDSKALVKTFEFNKATGKRAILNSAPEGKYTYRGAGILTDGIRGGEGYNTGMWIGYHEEPLDVTVDLGGKVAVSSVTIGTWIETMEWVFPPTRLVVYGYTDKNEEIVLGEIEVPIAENDGADGLREYTCDFAEFETSRIRIVAYTTEKIPDWHGAAGERGYLFVDEIIIE